MGYHSAYEVEIRNREWEPGEAGYNPENPLRNAFARFSIANAHEFHKAAYFDPVSETYFDYASGSNVAPTPVAGGTEPDTLVVQRVLPTRAIFDADVNNAGALSAFGTMGQIPFAQTSLLKCMWMR